jgi:cell division topological specificity factor
MSIFNLFRRPGSAPLARERLQILLSHERTSDGQPNLLAILREEILATIAKQVTVERENVQVRMERGATVSTLEIDVEIPHLASTFLAPSTNPLLSASLGSATARKPLRLLATLEERRQFFTRSRLTGIPSRG